MFLSKAKYQLIASAYLYLKFFFAAHSKTDFFFFSLLETR